MGGVNSGCRRGRLTQEATGALQLDVNRLVRALAGYTSKRLVWQWQLENRPITIALTVRLGGNGWGTVRLQHAAFEHLTAKVAAADYMAQLVAEPCRFGGRRWFFLCPTTGHRCAKLFLPNGGHYFLSRNAYRLAYQSQRQTRLDLCLARLGRLYRKLGSDYQGLYSGDPPRPKGMRLATYKRLLDELDTARNRFNAIWTQGAAKLLARRRR